MSERKHRIAIDARSYESSSGAYVRNLIVELQEIDSQNEYHVFVSSKTAATLRLSNENFSTVSVDAPAYSLREQLNFLVQLIRGRYDLVHFAMQQQPILYPRLRLSTFHDLTIIRHNTLNKGVFLNCIFRMVASVFFFVSLRASRLVIVPSESTQRNVIRFARLPLRKTRVTLEAADVTSKVMTPYAVPFERYLLYVGNFYPYKNVRRLVEAHQRLLKHDPGLGLVLVGRIHRAAIGLSENVDNNHYRNVLLTGYLEEGERNWLYANCAAYVFPSLSEGFGLPGLEAMAFGAPVVAARATSLPEVYRDGAAYFDPTDVDEIVRVVGDVVASPRRQDELRLRGARVLKTFSWRRMAEQTLAAYNDVLSEPAS